MLVVLGDDFVVEASIGYLSTGDDFEDDFGKLDGFLFLLKF